MLEARTATNMNTTGPDISLYRSVMAGFVLQGTTLNQWCCLNGINRSWAFQCLTGRRAGPAADALIARLRTAAGLVP